jgi:hypothetical protein
MGRPDVQNETVIILLEFTHRFINRRLPLPFDRPSGQTPGPRLDREEIFLLCDLGDGDESTSAVTGISPCVARSARNTDAACHWFGWDVNGLGDRMGWPAGETLVIDAFGEEMVTLVTL